MDFEEFVTRRVPVLLRTAAAISGDLALAEDLVQEVLLKVHRRWDDIAGMQSRDAYVRRMLVNEFLSWRRKWARIVPTADPAVEDNRTDHAGRYEDRQVLRAQIHRLPARQRIVLALRYYEDLADADIAETLECRVGTVRSLASRALAALRVDPVLRSEFIGDPHSVEQGHPA